MHGILTNVIYTGTVDQKGSLYPGEHERIIDQNTWDRTHETLRRNNGDNGASLLPCGTPMMHTYTMRKSKRYRYYVCYNAQQQGWKNCETKSVPAQAIESAVLDSIRRIGTDPKLAEAVATEALNQVARRRQEIDKESESQRRSVRQLNQDLAREAAEPAWTPARGSSGWVLFSVRSRPWSAGLRSSPVNAMTSTGSRSTPTTSAAP